MSVLVATMRGVHTAQGVWRSCAWNAVMVSALTQVSVRELHSDNVLTKNECLYWAVCDRICLNLKLWWCLVLGSAGSKIASVCIGMLHLTILKNMASRISLPRFLRGAQFRSFSNDNTLLKRIIYYYYDILPPKWMCSESLDLFGK